MNKTCYVCEKGTLYSKKTDFKMYGVNLGKFDAEVCDQCGETLFSESSSDKIDVAARKAGVWGLEAETTVGEVGNSLDVRINKKLAAFVGLTKGTPIRIYPEGKKKVVIESVASS
ncbi:YgiT-type zinc finger protein [Candidatus Woesearchaeota archaeon]|nr:YgiT-type zinc finger protein [Candidatus Woesearchaeota archaeon]